MQIEINVGRPRKLLDINQIIKLYTVDKLSINTIAIMMNVSFDTISTRLKENNISINIQKSRADLTGKQIGKLTALKLVVNKRGYRKWQVQCNCGRIFIVCQDTLKSARDTACRKCNYVGEINSHLWHRIINNAKVRKLEFSISKEYIWNLFLQQNRKCALSGTILEFYDGYKNFFNTTASLDRIDSSKGYIEGNVQWVHKEINMMKQGMIDNKFINWCEIITNFQQRKGHNFL